MNYTLILRPQTSHITSAVSDKYYQYQYQIGSLQRDLQDSHKMQREQAAQLNTLQTQLASAETRHQTRQAAMHNAMSSFQVRADHGVADGPPSWPGAGT
jgi:hypothetical protein